MKYEGPSSLVSEEKLLQMLPIGNFLNVMRLDPEQKDNKEYMAQRNAGISLDKQLLEYLIRSRRKAAAMLNLDSKKLAQDPMLKGNPKDWYLVELKGFEKSKINKNSQGKRLNISIDSP